jgi:hypothetical protein
MKCKIFMITKFLIALMMLSSVIGFETNEDVNKIFPAFNETDVTTTSQLTTSYSSSAAVKYADSYCASHSEWLCAEFVARSLNAG